MSDTSKVTPKHPVGEELKDRAEHLGDTIKEGLESAADKLKEKLHHDGPASKV